MGGATYEHDSQAIRSKSVKMMEHDRSFARAKVQLRVLPLTRFEEFSYFMQRKV